jgi:hypothetical protein
MLRNILLLTALFSCVTSQEDSEHTATPPGETEGPSTADLLEAFYADHGGKDAFPTHQILALETLLYAQDEIESGDWESAASRVDTVFAEMPLSTSIWMEDLGHEGLNIGAPVAYYGLRMLDQILDIGQQPATGTLQMTAVVAPCAEVSRPTLPDLKSEIVSLDIAEEILADNAHTLVISTRLFRRWVQAISGGMEVELVVYEMTECTTVDFTDDGSVIVSYPDANSMVASVPDEIAQSTDFWWVVAPSGVPGDGSGYDRHFITGGMGGYGMGLPLFLSDDAWFTRKPEHLGTGSYTEIETRAYQPQWFQHEFMHHIFRTWPEFGLEDSGHQWFDRTTWPDDFEGVYESDYYAEAITKRLLGAEPSMAEGFSAPEFVDLTTFEPSDLVGSYLRSPQENEWHTVTVSLNGDDLLWSNAAGVSWSLEVNENELWTGADCPYGIQKVPVEAQDGAIVGLWFGGEKYARLAD